jgi:biotin transport system ATP-binding protein
MNMHPANLTDGRTGGREIALRGLCVEIEGKAVLQDITLTLDAARIGVVGRNGSGKSTLARVLAGLVTPSRGEARVAGLDLARDRRAALREVGLMFQNPDHQIIFPTVIEEIAFGLRQLGQTRADAERAARHTLAAFGKAHWEEAHVTALSQGQKHLLCLMAVVAMRPRIILLDEPFSGLDIPTRLQLNRYLARYEGGIVHVSHDPADLEDYDHVVWLERGRLRAAGAAETVLQAYKREMRQAGGTDDISYLAR